MKQLLKDQWRITAEMKKSKEIITLTSFFPGAIGQPIALARKQKPGYLNFRGVQMVGWHCLSSKARKHREVRQNCKQKRDRTACNAFSKPDSMSYKRRIGLQEIKQKSYSER